MGLAEILSLLAFRSKSFFHTHPLPSKQNEGREAVSGLQEKRGTHPRAAPPAPPPVFVPRLPRPLSRSRAAAHMVPCQIPGGSVGHVSASQQLRRPCVTMETEANGRAALPAGAEPSGPRAGGAGRAMGGAGLGAGRRRQHTVGGARVITD